jgi:hypothetical protein
MRICLATFLLACSKTPDGDPSSCVAGDEICDEIDNDCDGEVDEGVTPSFFADLDGDGHGNPSADVTACVAPAGYATTGDDCDDTRIDVHLGGVEVCDGVDNDCNLAVDDGLAFSDWYADEDGDGFGDPEDVVNLCAPLDGFVADATDCDDANAARFPGAPELCNLHDDDCDGVGDQGCVFALDDASFRMESIEPSSNLGVPVVSADVDGDGVSDIVAGAPTQDFYEGEVYVVFGPATGTRTTDDAEVTITTEERLGLTVEDAADADGDGFADLALSGFGVDSAYLFLGPVTVDMGDVDADARFVGPKGSGAGIDVDIVPDADGDAIPDVVVGTFGGAGTVYVASGATAEPLPLADYATYVYEGGEFGDYLGWSTADAGDTNGDGIEEIAMAAPLQGMGRVYVIEGGADPGTYVVDPTTSSAVITGTVPGDFGLGLVAADADGDGTSDLFVRSPSATSSTGHDTGLVYAFLGPLSGRLEDVDADAVWEHAAATTRQFGACIASGGDIDGDGSVDTVLCTSDPWGAPAAYVQLGFTSGTIEVSTLDLQLAPATSTTYTSELAAAAFVSDWDDDGADEVLLGGPSVVGPSGVLGGVVWAVGSAQFH